MVAQSLVAAALLVGATACIADAADFSLASGAFAAGATIPREHTCDGKDASPALAWQGAPAGTKALALVVDDPDAPAGTWVHWVVYDLPATATSLPAGVPHDDTVAGGRQGKNDFRRSGYGGPCPPPGAPHHYRFTLYALDAPTGLAASATKADLLKAIAGHTLGEAKLVGTYGR